MRCDFQIPGHSLIGTGEKTFAASRKETRPASERLCGGVRLPRCCNCICGGAIFTCGRRV